jgi:hypothetical protein
VQLFMAMATQWRDTPAGHHSGLDYAALERPERQLRLYGRRARDAFAGLQVMEAEWLSLVRAEAAAKARANR